MDVITPLETIGIAVIVAYFIAISIVAVIVTMLDKSRARSGDRRVPEATLFFIAAIGGSLAMWLTMRRISHKTRHAKFMVGLPLMMALQVILGIGLWLFVKPLVGQIVYSML